MVVPVDCVFLGESWVVPIGCVRNDLPVVWLISISHSSVSKVARVVEVIDELLREVLSQV